MGCHIAYTFFRFAEMSFGCLPPGTDQRLGPFLVTMSFPGTEVPTHFAHTSRIAREKRNTR